MDEVQEAAIVEANLDALGDSATAEQILQTIRGYSEAAVSIALRRLGGGGGGGAVTLLGPFAITFETAGLVDPGDNGVLVGTVPAGSLVLAAWIETTTPWVAATNINEVDIVLNTTSGGLLSLQAAEVADDLNADMYELHVGANPVRAKWLAVEDDLAVAFYTDGGGLSAGAGNVYALVATV